MARTSIRTSSNEQPGLGAPAALLVAVLAGTSAGALAQSPVSGSISLGVRSVELAGTETKYREDINLDDGLRVFDIRFDYRPEGNDAPVDELTFSASSLMGDPYESAHFGARKYGAYNLRLDRRRSEYFYEDTILPAALASVAGSTGGDFHHFDFTRVRDSALLDLDLTPATRLRLGLERQTRNGESTTTLDIERDEFELEKPIDEMLERLRLGVEHEWERVTLSFEEELNDFENTNQVFLPGASPGMNTQTNPAELQYYFLDQSYDYDSLAHTLRIIGRASERLNVAALWRREELDLDMRAAEQAEGSTFTGAPFTTDLRGTADTGRDIESVGIDLSYAIGDRARLVAATRSSTLDQQGFLLFGTDQGAGGWNIETDGLELGAEIAVGANILLSAGRSSESRDVASGQSLGATASPGLVGTDRDGYFLKLRYSRAGLTLQASIDDNSIDDPFSLAAPTDSRRHKLSLRYLWQNGMTVQLDRRETDVGNDNSGWLADTEETALRLAYRRERLELSAGVATTDIAREIDQLVVAGTVQALYPIDYASAIRLRDFGAQWRAHDRLTLGGSFGSYDNRGSYPLERDDHRIFVDFALTADYRLIATYRDVDYAEDAFDAYDADILEFALRVDW